MADRMTIPARKGLAVRAGAGGTVRVINSSGTQVVDSWAFNAADPGEFLSMEHSRVAMRSLSPRPGDRLVSNRRRAMLTLLEDTSGGVHDTLFAACDMTRYRALGVEGHHDNCQDNLWAAMRTIGVVPPQTPCPLNLFMNIPWDDDGALDLLPPVSEPGSHVRFRAEMDLILVFSACPMDLVPINGVDCMPTDAHVEIAAAGRAG